MDVADEPTALFAAKVIKKSDDGLNVPSPRRAKKPKNGRQRQHSSVLLLWNTRQSGVVLELMGVKSGFYHGKVHWRPRYLVVRSRGLKESRELLIFSEHTSAHPRLCITIRDGPKPGARTRPFNDRERACFGPFGFLVWVPPPTKTKKKIFVSRDHHHHQRPMVFRCANEGDEQAWCAALETTAEDLEDISLEPEMTGAGRAMSAVTLRRSLASIKRRIRRKSFHAELAKRILHQRPLLPVSVAPPEQPPSGLGEIGELTVEIAMIELAGDVRGELMMPALVTERRRLLGRSGDDDVQVTPRPYDRIPNLPNAPASPLARFRQRQAIQARLAFRRSLKSQPSSYLSGRLKQRQVLDKKHDKGAPDSLRHVLHCPLVCTVAFHDPQMASSLDDDDDDDLDEKNTEINRTKNKKTVVESSRPIVSLAEPIELRARYRCVSSLTSMSIELASIDPRRGCGVTEKIGKTIGARLVPLHEILERDAQRVLKPVSQFFQQRKKNDTQSMRDETKVNYDDFHAINVVTRRRAPDGWAWYALRKSHTDGGGVEKEVKKTKEADRQHVNSTTTTNPSSVLDSSSSSSESDVVAVVLCRIRFAPKLSGLLGVEPRRDRPPEDKILDRDKVLQYLSRADAALRAFKDIRAKIFALPKWQDPRISLTVALVGLAAAIFIDQAYYAVFVPLGFLILLGVTLVDRLSGEYARKRVEPPMPPPPLKDLSKKRGVRQFRRTAWLRVAVLRGRNLKAADFTGFSDPYVRLTWRPAAEMRPVEIGHTRICHRTLHPVWCQPLCAQCPTGNCDGKIHFSDKGVSLVVSRRRRSSLFSTTSSSSSPQRRRKSLLSWGKTTTSTTSEEEDEEEEHGRPASARRTSLDMTRSRPNCGEAMSPSSIATSTTTLLRSMSQRRSWALTTTSFLGYRIAKARAAATRLLDNAAQRLGLAGLLRKSKVRTPLSFRTVWARPDGVVYPESFRIPVLEPLDDDGNVLSFEKCQGHVLLECFDADGIDGNISTIDDFLGQVSLDLTTVPRAKDGVYSAKSPFAAEEQDHEGGWLPLGAHRRGLGQVHGLLHFGGLLRGASSHHDDLDDDSDASSEEQHSQSAGGTPSAADVVSFEYDDDGGAPYQQSVTSLESMSSLVRQHTTTIHESSPLGAIQVHCVLELPEDETTDRDRRPTPAMWAQMLTFEKLLEQPKVGKARDWFLKRMLKTFSMAVDKQRQLSSYVRTAEQVVALLTWVQPRKTAIVAGCLCCACYVCIAIPSRYLLTLGILAEFGRGYYTRYRRQLTNAVAPAKKKSSYWHRLYNLIESLPTEPDIDATFMEQRNALYDELSRHALRAFLLATWSGKLWHFSEASRRWSSRFGAVQDSRLLLWVALEDAAHGMKERMHVLLHQGVQVRRATSNPRVLVMAISSQAGLLASPKYDGPDSPRRGRRSNHRVILAAENEFVAEELVLALQNARCAINSEEFTFLQSPPTSSSSSS